MLLEKELIKHRTMSRITIGDSTLGELRKLLEDIEINANYLDKKDFEALRFLANKGSFENTELINTEKSYVPYISEVEEFNNAFRKPNNYTPVIPQKEEWMFVYNFIREELEEYREACENNDIVEVLDALGDITYVATGNGTMLHGLKDKFKDAYAEIHASNMSKICESLEVAQKTQERRRQEQGEPCHIEEFGDKYIVYRTRDRKVMKSIEYFRPNLKKFFKNEN